MTLHGRRLVVTEPRAVGFEPVTYDPADLAPREVLQRVEYGVISPGTELAFYTGVQHEMAVREGTPFRYPTGVGYVSVGRIVAKGSGVPDSEFAVGDRILAQPQHASLARVNVDRATVRVPAAVPPHLAGFARLAAISTTALRVAASQPGDWVAVYGLGLIGNFAAQLFAIAGCRVVGLELSERRRAIAGDCGLVHVIDPAHGDPLAEAAALSGVAGIRTVVEATGSSALALPALRLARRLGEVILLGSPRVPYQGDFTELLRHVHIRGVTMKGALGGLIPTRRAEARAGAAGPGAGQHSVEGNLLWLLDLIGSDALRVEPLALNTVKPDDVQGAYEGYLANPDAYL
ncbi:MAG TPA: zinc-binding dehydrogenase, partial [Chloroflexota bacterium]